MSLMIFTAFAGVEALIGFFAYGRTLWMRMPLWYVWALWAPFVIQYIKRHPISSRAKRSFLFHVSLNLIIHLSICGVYLPFIQSLKSIHLMKDYFKRRVMPFCPLTWPSIGRLSLCLFRDLLEKTKRKRNATLTTGIGCCCLSVKSFTNAAASAFSLQYVELSFRNSLRRSGLVPKDVGAT